jgi:hypothetical protein
MGRRHMGWAHGRALDDSGRRHALLLGTNRVVRDGKTVHKEFIWIETTKEGATLTVQVFREPAETVKYRLASTGSNTATFQNLEHKRLQTMRYTRAGAELTILLSGLRKEKEFEEEIKLKLLSDK